MDDDTLEVGNLFYRSPELMLAPDRRKEFGVGIDVWSVGAIIYTVMTRRPFATGHSYLTQLTKIFEIIGKPSHDEAQYIANPHVRRFLDGVEDYPPRLMSDIIPSIGDLGQDLLSQIFTRSPHQRISVIGALAHPFFDILRCPEDEPLADSTVDFTYEMNDDFSLSTAKEMVWQVIGGLEAQPRSTLTAPTN